jgi:hypothetical protein
VPGAGLEPATPQTGQRLLRARTLPVCLPGPDDRSCGHIVRSRDEHMFVYGEQAASAAIVLHRMGLSRKAIARQTGISIQTISRWCRHGATTHSWVGSGSRRRQITGVGHEAVLASADLASYAYLLGIYLGDGHIAAHRRGVYQLRISMDSRYPGLIGETKQAIEAVLPNNRANVMKNPRHNAVVIGCSSKALPILFPQHGPGPKHSRPIVLARWQRTIAFVHAEELVRGLIHSDGCRFIARQPRNGRIYRYSRYCFENKSRDIMGIFCEHLGLLGVAWTLTRPDQAQVARRESVALLDTFVGHKR